MIPDYFDWLERTREAHVNDEELPGMWESADFEGGVDEVRGPDWQPPVEVPDRC